MFMITMEYHWPVILVEHDNNAQKPDDYQQPHELMLVCLEYSIMDPKRCGSRPEFSGELHVSHGPWLTFATVHCMLIPLDS